MATYHLSVKSVSRATGRSAVAASAYRAAERLHNERDGLTHDYTRRAGVEAAFIVAPDGAAWAGDRAALWNAAEAAEKRKDAKVAREYEIALPHELDQQGRRALAREFAEAVVERFGVAADVAIHAPSREGDGRNWHAHVLTTTRRVEAAGLGAKTRELDVVQTSGPAVEALRELWAVQVNHALARIQSAERVDHRSFERQGRDERPTHHLGPAAAGVERRAGRRERAVALASDPSAEARGPAPERAGEVLAPPCPAIPGAAPIPPPAQDGHRRTEAGSGRLAGEGVHPPYRSEAEGPVRSSAGLYGAGAEPATRIGRQNAAVAAHNRALGAARAAWVRAQGVVDELRRVARAGVQWAETLVRGVGAQVVAEREARAREAERQRAELARAEAERQAAQERDAAARLAERERIAAELRRQERERLQRPAPTQAERDAARMRLGQAGQGWNADAYRQGLVEQGRQQAEQEQRQRRGLGRGL